MNAISEKLWKVKLSAILIAFSASTTASTATLSTGPSCTYQGLTVDAQGNIVVQCAGQIPPPPPTQPPPRRPPAPPGTCPAHSAQIKHFGQAGDKLEITAHSGQVTAIPLPKIPSGSNNSGYLNILDFPGSPPSNLVEISISKCPGIIDTNPANACNTSFRDVGYVSRYWFVRTTPRFTTPQAINAAGACFAPESEQWYLNVRWTYQACGFGAAVCGFKFYWSPGSH